ncbi:allantoicase [Helicostylum pulchrum]|uniref:Allantoicase domain-containing protein n=1 Tax=Helicostylum pulchrum TaxID=562976 RepID=A0ABP9Y986_9FUNG|nr:allantoicase [Helicostylum pulchrum]
MTNAIAYTKIAADEFKNSKLYKSINLASSALGTTVVDVTDDFFAPANMMLNPEPAIYCPERFVDTGSWMDGWESKRHNPTYDWCIVKLGYAGSFEGFDIDTSHFTGNQAPAGSVEGAYCPEGDVQAKDVQWTELLPKVVLPPNCQNIFALEKTTAVYTHLRLNNYPDGGIARFRAYGEVHPTLPKDLNELVDLVYVGNGGRSVQVSDEHYGPGDFLVLPGRGKNMGDGWQTARSRVEGYSDFVVFRLGAKGHILQAEVDTSHFKGNFPRQIKLEGTYSESVVPEKDAKWSTLVEPSSTGAHGVFYFNTAHTDKVFTHAKISIIPDGGFKRLRLYGIREGGKIPTLPIVSPSIPKNLVTAEPLTSEAYAPYGQVIQSGFAEFVTSANQGTAEKHHQVAQVVNNFPNGKGKMHMCVFQCLPTNELPFTVKLLERHPYSSQAFIPMTDSKSRGYLAVVALNGADDKPDMSTLKAFVATSKQGINYNPGVWHHPMVALEYETDFAVVVHESGVPEDDCHEVDTPHVVVQVPGYHIF